MEEESQPEPVEPEPPASSANTTADDKGRMKLPVSFERYLRAMGGNEVWVTSLDFRSARIYSKSEWRKQEELFNRPGPTATAGEILLKRAKGYGHYTTLDTQGRVLLPARLRKEAGLEGKALICTWIKQHVEVETEDQFEEGLHREADSKVLMGMFTDLGLT